MGSIVILRTLLLSIACAYAAASLTPLSAAGDDNDCALYLSGPGRTSSYDYSINLLKGNFGYEGQHTCITYDAVNQAYLEARNRIVVSQPKGDWKPEDFASVGELILDISITLARTYGLTYEEIEKGLPLIDTSRTLIREVCPPVFSHVECRAGKYRRIDGLCNNLQQPTWGATNAPFQRLIGPLFADGINAPRISHTGRDLPLSRVVSRTMHPDEGFHDHAGTVMVIAWGQFMDHDYTLTGTPLDPRNRNDPEECCKRPPHLKHPYCNEIRIPDDDYFYRLFSVKCIDFVRGFPSPRPGCRLGSRVPFNTLTGAIDGNTVYGVTDKFARKLRTGFGGLLRMNPVFKEYGLKDLLPLKLDIPDEGCTRPNKNMYCFEAGEIRVNEQLVLTVMHTLMAREHNRVAKGLAAVNPHWDDETLYQEARRITIAEIQHITYNEFLPILLGKDVMEKFGLVLEKEGHWDGYDPNVNPDVIDAFASAAYRFGHSLLPTAVERWSKAHKFIASKRLSDLIRRPYDLYRAGVLDEYVMGLMNQVAQAMDDSITQEVTNHLFKKVGARFGMDLVSFNMQRGREFGIPGYMEFRKFCGLPGAETFQDLFGAMSNETVLKYETIFEHPIDVDLWSGGVSERPLPGSMLGPTFACVIATQFSYSRRGDRFWFELPNQPSSFTPEQLHEIRKSRLARVICDNTDIIDTVQLYPMVLPDHELNPRVPCRSGIIPSMDFSKWAEPAPAFRGAAKQFITEAFISPKNETSLVDTMNIENENATTLSTSNLNEEEDNKVQLAQNNDTSLNDADHLASLQKCTENSTITEKNCNETNPKTKDSYNSDTILKYVHKKGEKPNFERPAGHFKNTLKRRKRHANIVIENLRHAASVPVNVSYETNHAPIVSAHLKKSANVIQGLADFNIETLHDEKLIDINNIRKDGNDKRYETLPPNVHHQNARFPPREENADEGYKKSKNIQHTRNQNSEESKRESNENEDSGTGSNADGGNKTFRSSSEEENYHDNRENTNPGKASTEHNNNEPIINKLYQESVENEDNSDERNPFSISESVEEENYRDNNSNPDRENEDYRDNGDDSKSYTRNKQKASYLEDKINREPYRESEESNDHDVREKITRPHHESNEREDYLDDRIAQPYRERADKTDFGDGIKNGRVYQNSEEKNGYRDNIETEKSSKESSENADDRNNEKNTKPYSESNERQRYRDESGEKKLYGDDRPRSNENEEKPKSREIDTDSLRDKGSYESKENDYPNTSYSTPLIDSSESHERESSEKPYSNRASFKEENNGPPSDKSNYILSSDESEESKENDTIEPQKPSSYHNKHETNQDSRIGNIKNNNINIHPPESSESVEEEIIAIMTKKKNKKPAIVSHDDYKSKINKPLNVSSPVKIQEVDLGDFSYETVHVNDQGKVVPTTDTHESYGTSNAEPLTTTPVPNFTQSKKLLESLINVDDPIYDHFNSRAKHTIKTNHGEIKPVVELNRDSNEIHDKSENNKKAFKTIINNEDTSLETLLGVEITDDDEQNDKLVDFDPEPEKGNVKQEFERIPLNYNHDKDNQKQRDKESTLTAPHYTSEKNTEESTPTDGTLDTFTPPEKYDDHLNINFDYEPLKLPEIKLPEDILSYAYEKPSDEEETNAKKPKFYHYSDEDVDEPLQKQKNRKDDEDNEDDEDDDDHHGYYGFHADDHKNDYRSNKKEDDDGEDEDLYEKFVRERFGKRPYKDHGKSAKLRDLSPLVDNTELYSKLRHVLKKTDNIQKEAEKSGDPNAGYMWTLEYGQPL